MQEKYGFIYLWYDSKYKRYYLGSHWGFEDDGYICSSNWMQKSFSRRRLSFKRRIIEKVFTNRKDLLSREGKWLSLIKDDELGKRYYNFNNKVHDEVWWANEEKIKSVGEKISKSNKGRKKKPRIYTEEGLAKVKENTRKIQKLRTYNPTTDETKKKQSESRLAYFENGGEKINSGSWKPGHIPANKGKKASAEIRMKLSEAHKGHRQSEETKEKRKEKLKGRKFIYHPQTLEIRSVHKHELEDFIRFGFVLGKAPRTLKNE